MQLFNTPDIQFSPGVDGGDGSFLHKDVVLQKIVKNLTPVTVYNDNSEFIDAFSQTLVNYSPVSINILDYWSKRELQQVIKPLSNFDMTVMPEDKLFYINDQAKASGEPTAFFINSIIVLQEKLAETFMNNFYTTAFKTRTSHTLRQKLYHFFTMFEIDINDANNIEMLFGNINTLFKQERFITNKEFNEKKGKVITLSYAARAAWEAKIEGPLTSTDFFLDFFDLGAFSYRVESVLLGDVYNAFVKPITHPIGMGLHYIKVCKIELSDKVLNRIKYTADAITVKCTFLSDTSPLKPPSRLLPSVANPDYDNQEPISDDNPEFIDYLPFPSAIQNTEKVKIDESLSGPWDPETETIERVFATKNGLGLWSELTIDQGNGNILIDIEYGYGDYLYAGMTYTKWIFKNGAYLVDYECMQENGKIKHIIEYYRFDIFDISIHMNIIAQDTILPKSMYPEISDINIVHGENYVQGPNEPIRKLWPYGVGPLSPLAEETSDRYIKGLDIGSWSVYDGESPLEIPTDGGSVIWDTDSNVINKKPRFLKVYALGARFIETRRCQVNAYNLKDNTDVSIEEEFSIERIVYNKNIIHKEDNVINLVPDPYSVKDINTNITNSKQEK